jgi:hypothetical protein
VYIRKIKRINAGDILAGILHKNNKKIAGQKIQCPFLLKGNN